MSTHRCRVALSFFSRRALIRRIKKQKPGTQVTRRDTKAMIEFESSDVLMLIRITAEGEEEIKKML